MTPEGGGPFVLALTGTDKHPFDRLVTWLDQWLEGRRGAPVRGLIQYGTAHPPDLADGVPFLDHDEVVDLMGRSSVVVTHGGPTTISEARKLGHRPLVVPRRSSLGEHVDDHQLKFTDRLARSGLVELVTTASQLAEAIDRCLQVPLRRDRPSDPDEPSGSRAASIFAEVVDDVLARRIQTRRR